MRIQSRRAVVLVLVVALAAGLTAMAQQRGKSPLKLIRLTGWLVDDAGGKKHANDQSKDAVLASVDNGSPLIFWTDDDRFYKIDNAEQAMSKVGQRWIVMGTITEDESIRIGTFIDPETREAVRAQPRQEPKVRKPDAER